MCVTVARGANGYGRRYPYLSLAHNFPFKGVHSLRHPEQILSEYLALLWLRTRFPGSSLKQ